MKSMSILLQWSRLPSTPRLVPPSPLFGSSKVWLDRRRTHGCGSQGRMLGASKVLSVPCRKLSIFSHDPQQQQFIQGYPPLTDLLRVAKIKIAAEVEPFLAMAEMSHQATVSGQSYFLQLQSLGSSIRELRRMVSLKTPLTNHVAQTNSCFPEAKLHSGS